MAAATAAPARPRTPRAASAVPLGAVRLLRVELRRNAMPWILPLIAALFWFDSYRPSTGTSALYVPRTFWNLGQGHTIIDFGPFVAGVAAWMGSRDGRRRLADLVTTTARPRWAAQLTTWAATAIWAAAAYLVFVGVMFAMYARQGVGGAPPWWWVAVGATAVAAFSAAGFAVGACWPSRFAAPVAAFGGFLAMSMSSQTGFSAYSGWALILPTNSNGSFDHTDSGIFYPWLPDLPIARIIFLAGIAVAALGLTGLPARAGGQWLRRAAVVVTLAGVAAAGTAVGLASTGKPVAHGIVIPALHDAANDAPIAYTPACGSAAGVQVCLNPAYRRWLPDVTAALAPVLAEVAGLPGAPVRATQVADTYSSGESGPPQPITLGAHPPVLRLSLGLFNLPGPCGFCAGPVAGKQFGGQLRLLFVHAFVGAGSSSGSQVQQAVQAVLLRGAGISFAAQPGLAAAAENFPRPLPGPVTGPAYVSASRFFALPATTRNAWLTAHLAALRAGRAHSEGPAMTTAGLHRPAPSSAQAAGTRRDQAAAAWRLVRLYLISRRVPMALALLAGLGALLWTALHWHWNIAGGAAARQFIPLTIETGAAAVIAVTTYGPFGEPERAAGRWLPWLRLGAAVAMTAAAFGALTAGASAGAMPGGTLALLRNLGGLAGIGFLAAAVLGGAFGWTGPMAYLLLTEGALAHRSVTPWIWPTRLPHDRGGAICASLVITAGLMLITVRGPRESARESGPTS